MVSAFAIKIVLKLEADALPVPQPPINTWKIINAFLVHPIVMSASPLINALNVIKGSIL